MEERTYLLNRIVAVQVSDTTGVDQGTAVGNPIKIKPGICPDCLIFAPA